MKDVLLRRTFAGLPDGSKKIQFWVDFGGTWDEKRCFFNGPSNILQSFWYILMPFGILFCGHWVLFPPLWN
jgi:hypothetical protein